MPIVQDQTHDALIELNPLHHLTFGEPPEVQGILFHPNGKDVYLHLHGGSIDAWDVCLAFSHWIIGIAIAALLLVLFRIISLRLRRKQLLGRMYCSRCNYDVSEQLSTTTNVDGSASDVRCPECGIRCTGRSVISGRSLCRRVLVPSLTVFLAASLLGGFLLYREHIVAMARDWRSWPSRRLHTLSQQPRWSWLQQYEVQGVLLQKFNLFGAGEGRLIYAGSSSTHWKVTLSSEGDEAFLLDGEDLVRVSTRSGAILGRAELPGPFMYELRVPFVVREDGESVYFFGMQHDLGLDTLFRWDIASGRVDDVFERQGWVDPERNWPVERTLQRLAPGGPAAWLSAPTFMEAYNRKEAILYLLDEDGKEVRSIDLGESIDYGAYPAVTADGTRAFFPTTFGNGIRGVDLTTGESLGVLRLPGWAPSHTWCVILSPGGRYLFVANDSVWVRDTSTGRWVARLNIPSNLYGIRLCVSPDGRWLGATAQRDPNAAETARGLQYAHDLVIWDLSSLPIDSRP